MKLTEINIYPIKSLKGISLEESRVEERGLQYDRRWMLVDDNNRFLTQREFPRMATIEVQLSENGLIAMYKGQKINIPFTPTSIEPTKVTVWSNKTKSVVCDNQINDWFSDVLETNCKLVFMPGESQRRVSFFYAVRETDIVSFADAYPFLLIGENSLSDLNLRLEKKIPMNRFRPNLVFNDSAAFVEDNWKKIKIGKTVFHVVKPCARCAMTTIDQTVGISDGKEPLKTLASYRLSKRSIQKKILFGQYMIAENVGDILRIGDKIEVIETKN